MSQDFIKTPDAQQHFTKLKTLLDEVNVEDRGCTERVYRGVLSSTGRARAPVTSGAAQLRLRHVARGTALSR